MRAVPRAVSYLGGWWEHQNGKQDGNMMADTSHCQTALLLVISFS
jgi:hypothetical protein